ncbi:MAG: abortive phage resistance protein [Oxalobacteraceae bacterium]|nr:MAG: abortive phage resistance protein [Oxalobacteraceae bacterium]
MPALNTTRLAVLREVLARDFVPLLPPLLDHAHSDDKLTKKNLSRAFGAFVLSQHYGLAPADATSSVVDDFDDGGIDAIHYHRPDRTLIIVQGKLKAGEQFQQAEAQKFVEGVRRLVRSDFAGFNANIRNRAERITEALDDCEAIQLLVTYVGERVSDNARAAIDALVNDESLDERRFARPFLDYGPQAVDAALGAYGAHPSINTRLSVMRARGMDEPRQSRFGVVWLRDLVALYQVHGAALFDRNIRNHLGDETSVNRDIRETLINDPELFFYLNNGVTALASEIKQRRATDSATTYDLRGFSIINGAQTIASAASVAESIDQAKVAVTIIKAAADGDFGKRVTRARNNQNPVTPIGFAALDDVQEQIWSDMKAIGFRYHYKSEPSTREPDVIDLPEAMAALGLLSHDPRTPYWIASAPKNPHSAGMDSYESLFSPAPSGYHVANAVIATRSLLEFARGWSGADRFETETYRYGRYVFVWVMIKRLHRAITADRLLDPVKLAAAISAPVDDARQQLSETVASHANAGGTPRSASSVLQTRNDIFKVLELFAIRNFAVPNDNRLQGARNARPVRIVGAKTLPVYDYPQPLFAYLVTKAPHIVIPV